MLIENSMKMIIAFFRYFDTCAAVSAGVCPTLTIDRFKLYLPGPHHPRYLLRWEIPIRGVGFTNVDSCCLRCNAHVSFGHAPGSWWRTAACARCTGACAPHNEL